MTDGAASVSKCVPHRVNAICVLLGLHQLVADGIADDCSGRSDIELAHRRRTVRFDRLDADIENLSHFPVAVTLRDQLNDHTFPRRQGSAELAAFLGEKGIEQLFRDLSGKKRLVTGQRFQGRDEILAWHPI